MKGAIAAGSPQTAEAGAEILRQGGNAVDAAVAATFASFVAESVLVNIGGSGIAHIYNHLTEKSTVYDFFSAMPGLKSNGNNPQTEIDFRKIFIDFGPAQQPFYIGRGSVAVSGVVAGLCAMVENEGRLPLPQILAPAVRLAAEGVAVTEAMGYVASLLSPIFMDTPKISAIYAKNGQIVTTGDSLQFPNLSNTLKQLGEKGSSLFYTGEIAHKILCDQQKNGGLLTKTDLSNYQLFRLPPITLDYRDYTILLPPPSSNGGLLIAFSLKLLADLPLSEMVHNSFAHLQLLAEVMRLTNIARAEWETENRERVEDNKHIDKLLAEVNVQKYRQRLKDALAGTDRIAAPISNRGPSNTTHISVADANGMLVSITTSAGENAGFMVDNTGVMLNNMLGEVDLHPNGFHSLPPGQRLTTMMSPTIILHNKQPVLAIGSGGSNRIRTAILQVISNLLDFKMLLAQAVDAPRLHFENNLLELEGGITSNVADSLELAGYIINRWPARNMFFGGTHAVARDNQPGARWTAVGDSRRGGAVIIVE